MKLLALLAVLSLTGCATLDLDTMAVKKAALGYRHYDPCIRCGEKWTQLPNWENEAIIRRARGEQW